MSSSSRLKLSRLVRQNFRELADNGSLAFVVTLLFAAVSFAVWHLRSKLGRDGWGEVLVANVVEGILRSFCFSWFVAAGAARTKEDRRHFSKRTLQVYLRFLVAGLLLSLLEFGMDRSLAAAMVGGFQSPPLAILWRWLSFTVLLFFVDLFVEVVTIAWVAAAVSRAETTVVEGMKQGLTLAVENVWSLLALVTVPFFLVNLALIPLNLSEALSSHDELWLARCLYAVVSCWMAALPLTLSRQMNESTTASD